LKTPGRFIFVALLFIAMEISANVKFSPQKVVDLVLSNSLRVKEIKLNAKSAELPLAIARGVFDINFDATLYYKNSKLEELGGPSDPDNEMLSFKSTLTKKFLYGTKLFLDYENTSLDSNGSYIAPGTTPSSQTKNEMSFSITQELLKNYFGFIDRASVSIAMSDLTASELGEYEDIEALILEALRLYWDTYVSKETLRERIFAREKYKKLVASVEKKARLGYSRPGELPRAKAEYHNWNQNVKRASIGYLKNLDTLSDLINTAIDGDIDFEIPAQVPDLPAVPEAAIEKLRPVRIEKLNVDKMALKHKSNLNSTRPDLQLVAKTRSSGVESSSGEAMAVMVSCSHQEYYLGLEFKMRLASTESEGKVSDSLRNYLLAQNKFEQIKKKVISDERNAFRKAASFHFIAMSAIKTASLRKKIVREEEISYRQGRIDISDLIRSYNEHFVSEIDKIKAIGDYHISLDELAALRDELVMGIEINK